MMRVSPARLPRLMPDRTKHSIENVIGHPASLRDPLGLVERPVDPEIDAALPVLFFRLGKSGETARHGRTDVTVIAFGDAIEFIRNKSEPDPIGPIKTPQRLEDRAAKTGVPGRIRWERRRKIRTHQITRRRAERTERWIAGRGGVAVAGPERSCSLIGFANAGDGPPKIPVEF